MRVALLFGSYGLGVHSWYPWASSSFVAVAVIATHTLRTVEQRELANRVSRSVADLRVRAVHYERVATMDPLTGVMSRQAFLEALESEHRRVQNDPRGSDASPMLFDLDDFKSINDDFGHQVAMSH